MVSVAQKAHGQHQVGVTAVSQQGHSSHCCACSWSVGNLGNFNQIKRKHTNLNYDVLAAAFAQPSSLPVCAWAVAMDPLMAVNLSWQNMPNYGDLTVKAQRRVRILNCLFWDRR